MVWIRFKVGPTYWCVFLLFTNGIRGLLLFFSGFLCANVTAELVNLYVCQINMRLGKKTLILLALAELPQVCFSLRRGWSWVCSCVTSGCTELNSALPYTHSTQQCTKSSLGCMFCGLEQSGDPLPPPAQEPM